MIVDAREKRTNARTKVGMKEARMTYTYVHAYTNIHTYTHAYKIHSIKNINVIIKLTRKKILKKKRWKVKRADVNTNNFEINEDNGFLTGVPKIFVVRLMGQVSQCIATRGEESSSGL